MWFSYRARVENHWVKFLKEEKKSVWQVITLPSKNETDAIFRLSFSNTLGYQLNSAECVDIRLKRVVPDHYCHYYPENVKPKPKLKECSMDPCPSRFVSLSTPFLLQKETNQLQLRLINLCRAIHFHFLTLSTGGRCLHHICNYGA